MGQKQFKDGKVYFGWHVEIMIYYDREDMAEGVGCTYSKLCQEAGNRVK